VAVAVKVEVEAALVKTKFPLVVGKEIPGLDNVVPDIGPMEVLRLFPTRAWDEVPNMGVPVNLGKFISPT
jgi:hypothetical protein